MQVIWRDLDPGEVQATSPAHRDGQKEGLLVYKTRKDVSKDDISFSSSTVRMREMNKSERSEIGTQGGEDPLVQAIRSG